MVIFEKLKKIHFSCEIFIYIKYLVIYTTGIKHNHSDKNSDKNKPYRTHAAKHTHTISFIP